jgi:hypothetical protein
VFIDPLSLRLDGLHVVPRALRDEFDRLRSGLDAELDNIPLPPAATGSVPVESNDHDAFYEEP